MFTHPGTKLMFMGDEFAQTSEWNLEQSLDWHLLQYSPHKGMNTLVKALNLLYKNEPALYQKTFESAGFEWIVNNDAANSVLVYARKGNYAYNDLIVAINLTPIPRKHYRFGVTQAGVWQQIFNSDSTEYWGSGQISNQDKISEPHSIHGKAHSIVVDLPPLAMVVFKKR
jgi:1,4-alpha-glucan branching enzyme